MKATTLKPFETERCRKRADFLGKRIFMEEDVIDAAALQPRELIVRDLALVQAFVPLERIARIVLRTVKIKISFFMMHLKFFFSKNISDKFFVVNQSIIKMYLLLLMFF